MKNKITLLSKVTFYLTMSDVFTWALMLVLSTITGLYIATKLETNEAVRIVGLGVSITSICRGLLQIPIGRTIDRLKSDKDDVIVLLAGNITMGFPYLLFPLINSEATFYILQCFTGVGMAMNLVSWRKLFAKNLKKDNAGLEYASYDTVMSLAMAIFSSVAGIIASLSKEFFELVIVSIGLLMISSGFWAFLIYRHKFSDRN